MSRRRRSDPTGERIVHRGPTPKWRGNRLFYVAVEGEVTEPDYLAYLNREFGTELQFLIHPLSERNGMNPRRVVARALEHRDEIAGDEDCGGGRDQVWALFDRDEHPEISIALREALAGGIRVGFSHPSFDLWLLLHFTDMSGQQNGSSTIVHEKLREHDGFESFGQRGGKSVHGRRAHALRRRDDRATQRARRLVDDCPTGSCSAAGGHADFCDPLRRDPSTDVWQLLVELGIVDETGSRRRSRRS